MNVNKKLKINKKYDKEILEQRRFKFVCGNDKEPYKKWDSADYQDVIDRRTEYYFDTNNKEYVVVKVGLDKFNVEFAGRNFDIKAVYQEETEGFNYKEFLNTSSALEFEKVIDEQILNHKPTDKGDIEVKDISGQIIRIENEKNEQVDILVRIYRLEGRNSGL